jgi:hypothetical protein
MIFASAYSVLTATQCVLVVVGQLGEGNSAPAVLFLH